MKYRFFHIPTRNAEAETGALNAFLAQHRVLSVDRQFVTDGQNSFWALTITYADDGSSAGLASGAAQGRKPKVDYREILDEQDFTTFAALRTLRRELAERDNVPAYALFTNEHLAAMVQGRVQTKADLARIDGIGTARVEKYGDAFLRVLQDRASAGESEGNGDAPDSH